MPLITLISPLKLKLISFYVNTVQLDKQLFEYNTVIQCVRGSSVNYIPLTIPDKDFSQIQLVSNQSQKI